jgi:hypothetical protein
LKPEIGRLQPEYDIMLAPGKIPQVGFVKHPDTGAGVATRFDEHRRAQVIPAV